MSRWTMCRKGHDHFGRHGAAGLLLVRDGRVLLQQRSSRVAEPGTWSIPGGAAWPGETAAETALREAGEETGLMPEDVKILDEWADTCGGWTYTTVLAWPRRKKLHLTSTWEGSCRWVGVADVGRLRLHPAFRRAWAGGLRKLVS